jgi:hypothetical protein
MKRHNSLGAVVGIGSVVTMFVAVVNAATLHVPGDQPTIQAAIDAAASGDEIVLAVGTYVGDGNRDLDFKGKDLVLRGTNPDDPAVVAATVIDCQGTLSNPHRALRLHSGEGAGSAVSGLTITNGSGPYEDYGGTGNTAAGAILCLPGTSLTIQKCRFVANYGGWGGAIHCHGANATITDCVFERCRSDRGGAILCGFSTPVIRDCIVRQCEGSVGGGGITFWATQGGLISHCVVSGCEGFLGGGIDVHEDPDVTLDNCLLCDNYAGAGAAAILLLGCAKATINSCTLIANRAGFVCAGIDSSGSDTTITNCILWGSEATYYPQTFASHPGVTVSYSNIQGGQTGIWADQPSSLRWGEGNIDTDPLLVADGTGVYHLRADSPCINAGDPGVGASTESLAPAGGALAAAPLDVFGRSRVVNGRMDMGAEEFVFPQRVADMDGDQDVDLADFFVFQSCFNGPNRPPARADCAAADLDGDADVDLGDFTQLQVCFSGPNRPSACWQ